MGCTQTSSFWPQYQITSAFLIILLVLSSTYARFMPQGRLNWKLLDNDTQVAKYGDEYNGNLKMKNEMIGSRPPRCEWKKYCGWCGKCEAIQVPIIGPRPRKTTRRDDISNYKPMGWKCKCGDFTFNP
uniref:EPIDERMAL PATTERNING FACTOR-like protein 2 n=1 Tax=Erigeron canadensis TaxID=72917 RepID=UPI001CB98DF4|nr:EPIDERMAL PATTERNING FACTOR-like protein 2 [Erigeron canadensis]